MRARKWNGKISLFSKATHLIYRGLLPDIKEFAKKYDYDIQIEDGLEETYPVPDLTAFISSLSLPPSLSIRPYQYQSLRGCIEAGRALLLSPVSSGKTLMIYCLLRYYNKKTIILSDSINLVNQMVSDFQEYGFDTDKHVHKIYQGQERESSKQVVITTWQSAIKQPPEWFDQFEVVIGDEAHTYDAKCLKTIMENLGNCKHRFGFTGTLKGTKTNEMVLRGLFGPILNFITTQEMISKDYASSLLIRCIHLSYSDDTVKQYQKAIRLALKDVNSKMEKGAKKYQAELDFIYSLEKRNSYIKNLALSLKGNTLIIFNRIDTHGVPLYDTIKKASNCPTYYVSGKTDVDEREEIRKIVNKHDTSIILASAGTFSKGINIPRLNNIIRVSPIKAQTNILQTIGRGLRKAHDKTICNFYDIGDDFKTNITLDHFKHRISLYAQESFSYKLYKIKI